jgi:hypothetical protein
MLGYLTTAQQRLAQAAHSAALQRCAYHGVQSSGQFHMRAAEPDGTDHRHDDETVYPKTQNAPHISTKIQDT